MSQRHRKQCRRYDVPGDAHFLTFSCFRRQPLLSRDRSRQWMVNAIRLGQAKSMYDLWAYVIMPEHVHLLILPHKEVRISSILTTIKQSISKCAIKWLKQNAPEFLDRMEDVQPNGKRHHRFWQRGGGYDRNLRSVRDIHEKIRYIHENPVRRGLVERAIDWKWSSAVAWLTGTDDPLALDRESVLPLTNLDDDVRSHLFE